MTAYDDFGEHLAGFPSAPFLFVGSGFSRRYLSLETWASLLEHFASMTDRPYSYYVTSGDNRLPRVASFLAENFHELWWADERFEQGRAEFAAGLSSREGPLKVEVARRVRDALETLPGEGELADELELLGEVIIDGVITTNYDGLLEQIFDDYRVYVGQDQLLFGDPQGVGEIYKIHGSADDPETLVLTESDYDRFRDRNPYLAAKLLTIFVEHPVVFLGYSLSDSNIQETLVSVARCLTTENLSRLQDRLIFVQWDPDATTPSFARSVISVEGFTIPVVTLTTATFDGVFRALGGLQRKFPARMLRQLKEHVFELVLHNEPKGRLFVQDIDSTSELSDVDVVFGVGLHERVSSVGYVGVSRRDLLRDVVKVDSNFDAARIVAEALPVLLQRAPSAHTPVWRYASGAGLLAADGSVLPDADMPERVASRLADGDGRQVVPDAYQARGARVVEQAGGDLATLVAQCSLADVLMFLPLLPRDTLDLDVLRAFLEEHQDVFDDGPSIQPTYWAKAVCLYDCLAYGPAPTV